MVNDNPYGNGVAIFTRDGGAVRQFQFDVNVGMVGVNVPIRCRSRTTPSVDGRTRCSATTTCTAPRDPVLHTREGRHRTMARSVDVGGRSRLPEDTLMLIKDRDELLKREEEAWAEFVAEVGRVPEHRRGDDGVVPGWSVNDLVFHNGRWAGVAATKLKAIGASGSAGEEDPDDVWQGRMSSGQRSRSRCSTRRRWRARSRIASEPVRRLHPPRRHRRGGVLVPGRDVRPLSGTHGGGRPLRRQPQRPREVALAQGS